MVDAPPENEGIRVLTINLITTERVGISGIGESLRGPRRPFEVSRENSNALRISADA